MARLGKAWRGKEHGEARNMAWRGGARQGLARQGTRRGEVRHGVAGLGEAGQGAWGEKPNNKTNHTTGCPNSRKIPAN
jgi:hypothetical protein